MDGSLFTSTSCKQSGERQAGARGWPVLGLGRAHQPAAPHAGAGAGAGAGHHGQGGEGGGTKLKTFRKILSGFRLNILQGNIL